MSDHPEICVIGRADFATGIGRITYAACELFGRSFPVSILPTSGWYSSNPVPLPSGRMVPVCRDVSAIKVWFYADVIWNGVRDYNYFRMPLTGLRIAQFAFDSSELPAEWVKILNDRFHLALATSPYLVDVARRAGVTIPVGTMPVALDMEQLLARPLTRRPPDKVRFVSIAAYHPRKEHETVVEAFIDAFGDRSDVALTIHSNLSFDGTHERLTALVADRGVTNVTLSLGNLPDAQVAGLVANADVFVNCSRGEGFSIGARDALALGKPVIVSSTGAHLDLVGVPGVFAVPAPWRVPARYPEIDNRIFGHQYRVDPDTVAETFRQAFAYVAGGEHVATSHARRAFAARFSFTHLAAAFVELLDSSAPTMQTQPTRKASGVDFPAAARADIAERLGPRAQRLKHPRHQVVRAHDGGFYSLFNIFFSHVVWNAFEPRVGRTLPDWDVGRLLARHKGRRFGSFCYGRVEDGNIWTRLFEPLFGLSDAEMNDEASLYANAAVPEDHYNIRREPLLTYKNAYQLYINPDFPRWRRWYNRFYRQHVKLRPPLAAEVENFHAEKFGDRFMIAAHVRHPSHVIEQPGGVIASTGQYIRQVREEAVRHGFGDRDHGWGIFLATDQDRVVEMFRETFGERVVCFDDVRRTRADEDRRYAEGPADAQGHMIQHVVAARPDQWSTRMAWEIVRDATMMSRCRVLLHVVSNVSTAIAYMNPEVELVFARPAP